MANFQLISDFPTHILPTDPVSRADVEHVLKHGYVVLENVFAKSEAKEAISEIHRLSGRGPKKGRNRFEGFDTTRIYALLDKTRIFDKFCILTRVLALNDYFLDPGYMISAFHTIQINPGEKAQELHYGKIIPWTKRAVGILTIREDDFFCQLPRPRPPMGTAIMIALDDFTEENGATNIIPGSHMWTSSQLPTKAEAKPMVCPVGSAVYFIGTTWHGGGANVSKAPRNSATVQYCQPYIRPIENQILAVDPRRLSEIPESIVSMMGYRIHKPFIGYADGLNPQLATERMMRRLQQPLDRNPPTFGAQDTECKL